jgi:hypothetical protein
MQRLHGFMGLTSGSTRWLVSQATSHAAAAGLRLSRKRRARPGHEPAPDPCSCRGPPHPGTLPRPGPYSEGPRAHPRDRHAFLGAPDLYIQGSGVPLWRSGPNDASWMYYLSLPRGAFRPAHVVGSGAILRVAWRCRTGVAPSYYRKGYP